MTLLFSNSDNLLNIGPIVNLTKMMVLHVVGENILSPIRNPFRR